MEPLFSMLEQTADGAYVVDENQRVIFWNQAAQDLLGFAGDEVTGRLCYEVLRGRNEQDRAYCRHNCDVMAATEAGEGVSHFNLLTRTKSGSLRWVDVSILGVSDPEGDGPFYAVHLVRDATQAKQREQFAGQILDAAYGLQRRLSDDNLSAAAEAAANSLTGREVEVLTLLARGLSTAEIAATLSIAPATVRNHIQNIMQKFQVRNRSAAVAYAFEYGVVSRE